MIDPVSKLTIDDVAFGGKGVAHNNGKAVFVPYVIDGEIIRGRTIREHRKFMEAEAEELLVSSPHRVEPRCPYFGRCGGCAYQHIDYGHQLRLKWRQVKETLRRVGKLENPPMRPFIPSPLEYEYRNRVTVHVREKVVGFFRRDSNILLDIESCPIASAAVNERLTDFRAARPPDGHYTIRAHGAGRVFIQTNDAVAAALLDLIDRSVSSPVNLLIDAYCGNGFFSKRLRARCNNLIGIDWNYHAIKEAQTDAGANEQYITGDVELELPRLLSQYKDESMILIVDPPATGLTAITRKGLLIHPPDRLIYVSCNPATLARDLFALRSEFECDSVTPLDMFPQTAEIEVAAELSPRRSAPR